MTKTTATMPSAKGSPESNQPTSGESPRSGHEQGARADIIVGCDIQLITPDLARAYLEKNTRNRPVSEYTVSRYAEAMKAGRWILSADAIAFDTEGALLNGQHRLMAIIKTKKAQLVLVTWGLSPKAFTILDQGKARSGADALAIEGFSDTKYLATCLRWAHFLLTDTLSDGVYGQVLPDRIVELAHETSPGMIASLDLAMVYAKRLRSLISPSLVAFAHWAWARHGEVQAQAATEFVRRLATGVGIRDEHEPAALLRELLHENARREVGRYRSREKLRYLLRAIKRHIEPVMFDRGGVTTWPASLKTALGEDRYPHPAPASNV